MHYITVDGRKIIDAAAGMWCTNAGHGRVQVFRGHRQAGRGDGLCAPVPIRHPAGLLSSPAASPISLHPVSIILLCNSGSEAVDTALKIALAYHQIAGQGSRTRLIGRERGYHGVGFGGTSVGGIVNNRKMFGMLLAGVDHLPHLYVARSRPSPRVSRNTASISPTNSSVWSTCTAPTPLPPSSSNRWRDRPAYSGAQGLSQAAARDHPEARYSADFRQGHYRLRPVGFCLCGGALRRAAGHAHLRQGRHQRRGPDGWRPGARYITTPS